MRLYALPTVGCCLLVGSSLFVNPGVAQDPPPNQGRNLTECGLLDELGLADAGRVEVAKREIARRGPTTVLLPMLRCVITLVGPKAENLAFIEFDPPRSAVLDQELATIARMGRSAVPELTRLVGAGGAEGALACGVLGMIGPEAASAAPKLLAATGSEDRLLRAGASNALPRLGAGAIPALIVGLSNANADIRSTAAEAIGKFALDPAGSVPALIKTLPDPEGSVRDAVAAALGAFGPAASSAVKTLLDPRVGEDIDEYGFGDALALIVADPATLRPALHSAEVRTRGRAAQALGQMPKGTALLLEGLAAESRAVRLSAVKGLRPQIAGPAAAEPVASLVAGGDSELQKAALAFLLNLGPAAAQVLPAIVPLLSNADPALRAGAIQSVEALATTPEQMTPVVASLRDADPEVQKAAAWALFRHPSGPASVPALLKLMREPGSSGYVAVVAASMGRVEALPPLRLLLGSDEPDLRRAAAYGLARLGPKAAGAADELLAALKADEPGRCDYWIALAEIGASGARGVVQARRILGDDGVIKCEARHADFSKKR